MRNMIKFARRMSIKA